MCCAASWQAQFCKGFGGYERYCSRSTLGLLQGGYKLHPSLKLLLFSIQESTPGHFTPSGEVAYFS